jgi:hypothetical protein
MTARDRTAQKQALQIKRAAMRKQMAQRIERRRAALPKKPRKQTENDRRSWRWLLLLLLLVPCLLGPCTEEEPVVAVLTDPAEPTEVMPVEPEVPLPPAGTIARLDRPEMHIEAPPTLPWIASFRMQVAARSPRLGGCFVGVAQPGALKWTTSVEPVAGVVSDDALEPTLSSAPLTRAQRACVLAVLADPPYRLAAGEQRSTPSRVALVIEF